MKFLPRILTRWTFWLIVAGVVVAYTAAGFLLVPRIVKSQIRSTIAENYARQAQVGDVRFNPFTFVLEIDKFALPDTDGRPMLQFDRLLVDFELISILRRAYSFKTIALDAPSARLVVRRDGRLNFADLQSKEPVPPKTATEEEGLPRLFINAFTVNSGRIDFEQHNRPKPFTSALKPITFALHNFSTIGTGDNAYQLYAESAKGEKLAWRGRLNANPVSSQGTFALTGVHAQTLWDYMRDAVNFEVTAGTLDLAGSYTFSLARDPVDLNAVVDEIKVDGLVLRPKGSTVDDVALGELLIRKAQVSVADRRTTVASISLTGGKILTWLEPDGTFSLNRLAGSGEPAADSAAREAVTNVAGPAAASSTTPEAVANTAAPPATSQPELRPLRDMRQQSWQVVLSLIETSGLEVAFEDRSVQPVVPIKLAPVNVKLSGYDSAKPGSIGIDVHVGIDEKGTLDVNGKLDPETFAGVLDLDLKNLDLRSAQPYIARTTDMTLLSGQLSTKGKLQLAKAQDDSLVPQFSGTVELAKLRTIDNALEQDFIRWDKLTATGVEYDGASPSLVIKQIVARQPYARVIIASNGSINVSEVLRPSAAQAQEGKAAPAKEAATENAKPLDVRIGLVRIDKASANFADFSLRPNFATGIQELSGTVTGLSSNPQSRAKVDLDGKVDAYAPVTIDGEVNYLSADSYTDMRLAFDNMELTTFNPYSGKFAGYRIEKGKLSVRLAYKVEDRKLNADHKIILNQLQLGERVESKDATSLPVKLAVALLKDSNGVIDLDLPVTGTLDDPKFRLGPLIWKIVVNLLTKIVTAPFALLGKLFGGGEQVNQLLFAPGGSELQGESMTRIQSVGKAMHERPGLELEVPIAVSPDLDRPFLQKTELDQRLVAIKRKELLAKRKPVDALDANVLADRQEYWRLLHEYAKESALLPPEEPKDKKAKADQPPAAEALEAEITSLQELVLPTVEVPETSLAELGKERAQKVQDLLLSSGEIEPARLFIITGKPAPNEGGLVRMDLSLR